MLTSKRLSVALTTMAVAFAGAGAPATGLSTPTLGWVGEPNELAPVNKPILVGSVLSEGSEPTGTITVSLYRPADATCSDPSVAVVTLPVRGNGDYYTGQGNVGEPNLIVHSIGLYRAILSYSGDQNNAPVATTCGGPSLSVRATPELVVTSSEPAIVGRPVHLLGTLRGGSEPSGLIEMDVFAATDANCEETPLLASSAQVAGGAAVSAETFVPGTVGDYPVDGMYLGDMNNLSSFEGCRENVSPSLTVAPATPTLALEADPAGAVGQPVAATARLSGGYRASGTVTFSLFEPGDPACNGPPAATVTGLLSSDRASSSALATSTVGRYNFTASYSGDHDNTPSASECGAAPVIIQLATLTIAVVPYSAGGLDVGEKASLSGGFDPTGTVTFTLFGPGDPTCAGVPQFRVIAPVIEGAADSGLFSTGVAGRFAMKASYGGDANNKPASGACQQIVARKPSAGTHGVVRDLSRSATRLLLRVACPARRPGTCRGSIQLWTIEQLNHRRVIGLAAQAGHRNSRLVLVGRKPYRIHAGDTANVTVPLTSLARTLAQRFGKLPVRIMIKDTSSTVPAQIAAVR